VVETGAVAVVVVVSIELVACSDVLSAFEVVVALDEVVATSDVVPVAVLTVVVLNAVLVVSSIVGVAVPVVVTFVVFSFEVASVVPWDPSVVRSAIVPELVLMMMSREFVEIVEAVAVGSKDKAMPVDKPIAAVFVVGSVYWRLAVDTSDSGSAEAMDSGMVSVDDRDMPKVDEEMMLMENGRHGPAVTRSKVSVNKATTRCFEAIILNAGKDI
jgi:hypothetical protein